MLRINGLTYRVGGRTLLDGASATLPDGHRVGLVGPNGAGKTTLLRLIAGEIGPDGGEIAFGSRESVGTVAQEAPDGAATPLETVLASDPELARLRAAAETVGDGAEIGEVHARLMDIDGHRAEARAARILAGLGFDEPAQNRALSTFSGGWRMRVALACALFREPDILLLDEPTNHLDLEASLWLESYLGRYPRTLLIVSHDRGFLNRIPSAILHLEEGRLTLYTGGYDRFERTRAEKQARQAALYAKQQEQRRHIQAFVDRFRYKASKARQAQSRLKMLERMEPIAAVTEDRAVSFDLPKPEILPPPILALEDVAVGYAPDAPPVLKKINLRIDMDDRIALLGANGNGKTTLLRLLADRLKPQGGQLRRSSKLEVGYFAQNQMEELTPTRSPVEELQALEPLAVEEKLRSHLGRFGFPQEKADTKIASLSGGEKARLALAVICRRRPQLLLLDEPTNHLDIDSREALIRALATFEGAVILVSHDMHLIETTADRLVLVEDGTAAPYDGDVADYRRHLLDQRRVKDGGEKPKAEAAPPATKKPDRKARADARARIAPLKKAAEQMEAQLERLTAERAKIDAKMADPALYEGDGEAIGELNRAAHDLDRAIERTEEAWLQAQDALDRANAQLEENA
jgi:ATP-binding cassette subfamily F protein 3